MANVDAPTAKGQRMPDDYATFKGASHSAQHCSLNLYKNTAISRYKRARQLLPEFPTGGNGYCFGIQNWRLEDAEIGGILGFGDSEGAGAKRKKALQSRTITRLLFFVVPRGGIEPPRD